MIWKLNKWEWTDRYNRIKILSTFDRSQQAYLIHIFIITLIFDVFTRYISDFEHCGPSNSCGYMFNSCIYVATCLSIVYFFVRGSDLLQQLLWPWEMWRFHLFLRSWLLWWWLFSQFSNLLKWLIMLKMCF